MTGKLKWRSRRGLLELDLLLVPFVEQAFEQLPRTLQVSYEALLEEEDQDILGWLQGHLERPERYRDLLEFIMSWNAERG